MSPLTATPPARKTSRLELVDSGVVYRNPEPGYQYAFACHSHAVQLSSGELLCAFQRGQALYSADSVIELTRSSDGGKTWSAPTPIHDSTDDDRLYSYHGPMLSLLPDGSLLAMAVRFDRSNPKQPLFNEVTGGCVRSETLLFQSADEGRSWSKPQVLAIPKDKYWTPSSPIVPLAGGGYFLSMDQWHAYEAPGPYQPLMVGLFSKTVGSHWDHPLTFADGAPRGLGHWHGRIIRLRDNCLYTLFWSAEMPAGKNLPLHYCIGSPDGRQWSTPEPTNIPGQTNWPVELPDGRMMAIYTVRESQKPGFYVVLSKDDGRTWDLDQQIMVWDATGRDKIGVHAPDSYPRSHDTISYGAPTAMLLDNGDCFFTFWCTEMSVTQIRYARVKVA